MNVQRSRQRATGRRWTKRVREVAALATTLATFGAALVGAPRDAHAEDPVASTVSPENATTAHARELFAHATGLSKRMQWADALSTFEEVARLHPHPIVTMNIAICERALGRYTRARAMFNAFLEETAKLDAKSARTVSEGFMQDARNYVAEIDALLVHLDVTVKPAGVRIAVDGRPLTLEGGDVAAGESASTTGRRVAGLAPPGAGTSVSVTSFELILDPGAHLILASRSGHSDVLVNRSFTPGMHATLGLELEKLQGHLVVDSSVPRARVVLDGRDVGLTPIDLTRPAGRYSLAVDAKGHNPYTTTVVVEPGQTATTNAILVPTSRALTTRWWFWAGAASVVAGGVLLTYAVTRPTPADVPYDGGGTGWVAVVK